MTAELCDFVIKGKIEGNKVQASEYLEDKFEHMYDVEDVEIVITQRQITDLSLSKSPPIQDLSVRGNED